jgi:hypothetical protein
MASLKQIEANRLNAQKSSGPCTVEGKAASSQNALKTGIDAQSIIIRGEDIADLETLTAEYHLRFHPQTPEQRHYVDCLIRDDWQLRRLAKADAQIWDRAMNRAFQLDKNAPLGHAFEIDDKHFVRLQRRIDSTHRSYKAALHELQRLQAEHPPDQSRDREGAVPSDPPDQSRDREGAVKRDPSGADIPVCQPLDPSETPAQPTENKLVVQRIGFVPSPSPEPCVPGEICGAGPLTRAGRPRPAVGSSAKSEHRHSRPRQGIPQALAEPLPVTSEGPLEPFAQGFALLEQPIPLPRA